MNLNLTKYFHFKLRNWNGIEIFNFLVLDNFVQKRFQLIAVHETFLSFLFSHRINLFHFIHRRVFYSSFLYSSIFLIFFLSGPSLRTGKKKSSCLVTPKFFWMTKKTGTEKLPCLVTPKFFWTENSEESVQYENLKKQTEKKKIVKIYFYKNI